MASRNNTSPVDVYQVITDRIISLLEAGTIPWHKPWATGDGAPRSLTSGKEYRGINLLLLGCAPFESPWWLTYKQAQERGGNVRRGEKGLPVMYWNWHEYKDKDADGQEVTSRRPFIKYYTVFNVCQCDGVEAPASPGSVGKPFDPIAQCEALVAGMPNPPRLVHQEQRAYYRPATDLVNMPRPESFEAAEEYYSTLYHELTHATGHPSRLDRPTIVDIAPFGSANYSREELVAEMGAAMLCGVAGIENRTIDNSAAYLAGWLGRLRGDNRLVVQAAAQAQRAADYVRGVGFGDEAAHHG